MTDFAVLWLRRDARISVMTREADRVTVRDRLERALLQPEVIPDVFRRLDDVLFARLALRLVSLVTNGTALGRRWFLFLEQNAYEESAIAIAENPTHHVDVLVMRKADTEFRNEFAALQFWISEIAKARKQPSRRVLRRDRDVAVRADRRRRPFAREELLFMTSQTR